MKIRTLLATTLFTVLLGACGGGGVLNLVNGGIGGTGISAGSITAFGSIYVNGVKYQVDDADFIRNGRVASGQHEFRVGEYVTVTGNIDADGLTGTASEVSFGSEIDGVVTSVSTDGKTIGILGQAVRVNALTVFHDFAQLSDLEMGNVVEVSGVRNAQGVMLATSLRLKQAAYFTGDVMLLKGVVQSVDTFMQTLQIGGLTVEYAGAALEGFPGREPETGQRLQVITTQPLDGERLLAAEASLQGAVLTASAGTEVELEGVITRFTAVNDFAVNGIPVQAEATVAFEQGSAADLAVDAFVEVEGQVSAQGILMAEEISVKQADGSEIAELEGLISAIDPAAATFTVLGQAITVNNSTIWKDEGPLAVSSMNFSSLNVGDFVEVKIRPLAGGGLLALRVEREDEEDDEDDE